MSDNFFLAGNYAPVQDELSVDQLSVIGKIPDDLDGVYMRNGPNPQFPPIAYTYPFDGDGMIHAVSLSKGKASYKNRYVLTEGLLAERRAGKALYGSILHPIPPDPKWVGEQASMFKNGAFIHIIRHAEAYLAMYEGDAPYELNAQLETLGLWKAGTSKPLKASPHTRLCPITGELWLINYDVVPPYLSIACVDKTGKLRLSKAIDKPYSTMLHDFVLTENYVIIYDCPVVFDFQNQAKGGAFLEWRPTLGTRIGLISRQSGAVQWIQTDPFFVFHFANAYEKGSQVVVDFVRHRSFELLKNSKESQKTSTLFRSVIDVKNNQVQHEALHDYRIEFPRIKEDRNSLAHRFVYAAAKINDIAAAAPFTALVKFDVVNHTSTRHDFEEAGGIGEAVFVPRQGAQDEDDGYLMLFVYLEADNNSELVILDAKHIADPPLARIQMPRRVPFGLHGTWMSHQRLSVGPR